MLCKRGEISILATFGGPLGFLQKISKTVRDRAISSEFLTHRVVHCYRSNEQNIIASLLKFAGYIHNHKILPGNIFAFILKNKMAARDVYLTLSKDFCWPSRAKGFIRQLYIIYAGYVPHYKIFGIFLASF